MRRQFQKSTLNTAGYTLIEMMVVLGVIVLIFLIALPSVSSYFQLSLNSATRDLATRTKEAYNAAVISGRVFRMVYDLKTNSYWVEGGPSNALLDTKETKEKAERKKKFSSSTSKKEQASEFAMDSTITRKKIPLPRGVIFEDVVTQQSPDPITEGLAYTHFFPHGIAEQTLIHLKDQSQHHATLAINPMIGMTDVYDRYVSSKEALEK